MRTKNALALATALILIGTSISLARPALADDAPLSGNWKLVVLPYGDDDFAIFNLSPKDGKTTATVVDAQEMLGKPKVDAVEHKNGSFTISLSGTGVITSFKGTLAKDGPGAGKFLGMAKFRGSAYPACVVPTKESKVGPLKQSPMNAKLTEIQKQSDPKSKLKLIEEMIRGNHGHPNNGLLYGELLSSAQAAGYEADKVKDIVRQWTDEAKLHGDEWLNTVRLRAIRAIASSKSFAKVTVELAQEADKVVSEADMDAKVTVLTFLGRAAKESGMAKLAEETDARRSKIDHQLDEEYHKKVPPFKPTAYSGRKDTSADQTVLMELFTGAQCPPCVAADVAFDALLTAYKPAEFIGLQYHLHIPGPDPLTNRDSEARQKYYGSEVQGTPSTFFNGKSEAGGGGGMANSETKYAEYRTIIDKAVETTKRAKIALSATRAGDEIKIIATAELTEKAARENSDGARSKTTAKGEQSSAAEQGKRVLRLALTEESIRYVGGNRLRYHHHVVRALPGGAKGIELKNGKGKTDVTVSVADLKLEIEKYLSEFTKKAPFPNPLPEIKLDKLSVVAFVQDDGDKSVLHAVSVPVKPVTP